MSLNSILIDKYPEECAQYKYTYLSYLRTGCIGITLKERDETRIKLLQKIVNVFSEDQKVVKLYMSCLKMLLIEFPIGHNHDNILEKNLPDE